MLKHGVAVFREVALGRHEHGVFDFSYISLET